VTQIADGFITVAKVGEIPEGGVKVVRVEDQPVAVFHVNGGYYAIDDLCTHDGGPLAEGTLEGEEIECPRHGARFNVKSGEALCLPATSPVPTYAVKVVGEEIKVGWAAIDEKLAPDPERPGAPAPSPPAGEGSSPPPLDASSDAAGWSSTAGGAPASPGAAPSQQEFAIRAALESVMDPEINLSVIDLGLIREVHVLPERTHIRMMLTTPFCPYAPQLVADVTQATEAVVPNPCEVELMPDPWSPDLMPDPGLLGYSF